MFEGYVMLRGCMIGGWRGILMSIVAVFNIHLGIEGVDEQKFIDFRITRDLREINQCDVVAFMCK